MLKRRAGTRRHGGDDDAAANSRLFFLVMWVEIASIEMSSVLALLIGSEATKLLYRIDE